MLEISLERYENEIALQINLESCQESGMPRSGLHQTSSQCIANRNPKPVKGLAMAEESAQIGSFEPDKPSTNWLLPVESGIDALPLHGDDELFLAPVSGCHIENAAKIAGISERTAYRRLADPEFRDRINSAREAVRASILAKLSDAAGDAVSTLWSLLESEDESIRLCASKMLLDALLAVQKGGPHQETTIQTTVERTQRTAG